MHVRAPVVAAPAIFLLLTLAQGACILDFDDLSGGPDASICSSDDCDASADAAQPDAIDPDATAPDAVDDVHVEMEVGDDAPDASSCLTEPCTVAQGAPFAHAPWALVSDGSRVLWSNSLGGSIAAYDIATEQTVLIAEGLASPRALALVDSALLIATEDGIVACTSDACAAPDRTILVKPVQIPESIAADSGFVYWTEPGSPGEYLDSALMRCPRSGCAAGEVVLPAEAKRRVTSVAVDADSIYYSERGGQWGWDGAVRKVAREPLGDMSFAHAVSQAGPCMLALTGKLVVWSQPMLGSGGIFACPIATTCSDPPLELGTQNALADAGPWGIAVDALRAYVTTMDAGTLVSAPLDTSSELVTHLSGLDRPRAVAVVGAQIFVTSMTAGGQVLRVSKLTAL